MDDAKSFTTGLGTPGTLHLRLLLLFLVCLFVFKACLSYKL